MKSGAFPFEDTIFLLIMLSKFCNNADSYKTVVMS